MLRSPFAEHYPWLPVRLLLRDRFPVLEPLADSEVPVTVVYGDRDSVVPTKLSERVADEAPALFERVVIAGADHNDAVMFGPEVAQAVARLAAKSTAFIDVAGASAAMASASTRVNGNREIPACSLAIPASRIACSTSPAPVVRPVPPEAFATAAL